jgi:hypothetical protein
MVDVAVMMTVKDLRNAIRDLPDEMPVVLEIARDETAGEWDDLVQSNLNRADVESRCDETDRLYLYGDAEAELS